MQYTYLIRSQSHPTERYTGTTTDLTARLKKHNEGAVPSTIKHKPWQLVTYLAFQTSQQATEFERYLKSGSGRAFANKRLWQNDIQSK